MTWWRSSDYNKISSALSANKSAYADIVQIVKERERVSHKMAMDRHDAIVQAEREEAEISDVALRPIVVELFKAKEILRQNKVFLSTGQAIFTGGLLKSVAFRLKKKESESLAYSFSFLDHIHVCRYVPDEFQLLIRIGGAEALNEFLRLSNSDRISRDLIKKVIELAVRELK